MSDKLKTKKYLLAVQMIIIAAVLLLNVFLFYSMECTNEYVQNRDVWGNTQTISRTDIRLQQQILNNLPQDMELGLTFLDSRLHTIEQAKKDEEERKRLTYLRNTFSSLLITGPFSILLGFNGGLMALNDRLKLRSMVVGEKDKTVYIASEECAIRMMEPDIEKIWSPKGGEAVIVRLEGGENNAD